MTIRSMAVAALLLTGAAPAAARQDLARPVELLELDEFVRTEMGRQKIPGVAVAVIRKGVPIKAQGYGKANVEHDVPVTPETIFQSGSVGKQFTAAVVMLLIEDGRVALTDPLTKFFPGAPSHWKRITVRHLLTHTSGLPDYTAGAVDYRKDYTEDDLLKVAYGLTLEFEPGARWNYSNTGYVVLGAIVRRASGKFYGDVLRTRVFAPLGMTTARVISEADIVPHRAAGYQLVQGELKNHDWVAPQLNTTADGSLYLSLQDMIAWDAGLRAKQILKSESWTQVFTPVSLNSGTTYPYGFGWAVADFAGRRAERHGGSWQGFTTHIARFPDDELTVIVLTNLAEANPERISEGIAALIDPSLARPELHPIPDTDTAMQARVRRLIGDAAAGRLSPKEFAYARAGFFPAGARAYASMLKDAGLVTGLTLLEKRTIGDDVNYTYDVAFAQKTLRMTLAVTPDGKLASLGLRPAPPR